MPTIPRADSLGQARPVDTSQNVYGRDTSAAGVEDQAMARLGEFSADAVRGLYEKQVREEVADAEVNFQIAKVQQDNAYDQDDDEDTIVSRYESEVTNQLGLAAADISDPEVRSRFVKKNQLSVEQGKVRMNALVFDRIADKQRAGANQATEVLTKAAIEGAMEPVEAYDALSLKYSTMADNGYMSHEEAQKLTSAAQFNIAVGKLKTMSAGEQIDALKTDLAQQLPLEMRQRLQEEAESELLDENALATAVKWVEDDVDIEEMNSRLDQITDPEERDKTRNRFLQRKNDEDVALQELQKDVYDTYAPEVTLGNLKVDEIPNLADMKLTGKQIENLYAAEDKATKRKAGMFVTKYSDGATYAKMRDHLAKGEILQGRKYFSENHAKLNENHFKYFQTQFDPEKNKDPAAKTLRTLNQTMTTLLKKNNLDKDPEVENLIWDRLNERRDAYIDREGKAPTDREVQEWVKDEFVEVKKGTKWLIFDDDVMVRDMSTEDRQEFFQAMEIVRSANPNITREDAIARYEQFLLDRRNAQ